MQLVSLIKLIRGSSGGQSDLSDKPLTCKLAGWNQSMWSGLVAFYWLTASLLLLLKRTVGFHNKRLEHELFLAAKLPVCDSRPKYLKVFFAQQSEIL